MRLIECFCRNSAGEFLASLGGGVGRGHGWLQQCAQDSLRKGSWLGWEACWVVFGGGEGVVLGYCVALGGVGVAVRCGRGRVLGRWSVCATLRGRFMVCSRRYLLVLPPGAADCDRTLCLCCLPLVGESASYPGVFARGLKLPVVGVHSCGDCCPASV